MIAEFLFISFRRHRHGKLYIPKTFLGWVLEIIAVILVVLSVITNKKAAPDSDGGKAVSSIFLILAFIFMAGAYIADTLLK